MGLDLTVRMVQDRLACPWRYTTHEDVERLIEQDAPEAEFRVRAMYASDAYVLRELAKHCDGCAEAVADSSYCPNELRWVLLGHPNPRVAAVAESHLGDKEWRALVELQIPRQAWPWAP